MEAYENAGRAVKSGILCNVEVKGCMHGGARKEERKEYDSMMQEEGIVNVKR